MFAHSALVRGLFTLIILFASGQAFAQSTPPAPLIDGQEVKFVDSSEAAREFTKALVKRAQELKNQGNDQVIVYWHLKGERQSPYLQELLLKLNQSGVAVMGREITAEDLETQVQATEDFLIPAQSASPNGFTFRDRFKELKTTLFGTPLGITFLEHFWRKKADGQWSRTAPANPALKMNGTLNGAVAVGWYYATAVVAPHLLKGTSLIPSPTFAIASAIVFSWVRFFWDYAIETATFKTQAKKVEFGEHAISFKNSRRFYTLVTLGQGVILNSILLMAVVGVHNLSAPIAANALLNAVLSTFAFSPMEKWFSEENLKAKALKEQAASLSDEDARAELLAQSQEVSRRATRAFNTYMMVFLPMMKNSQLFLSRLVPGWGAFAAMVPLLTTGAFGFGVDIRTNSPDFASKAKRTLKAIVGLAEGTPASSADLEIQGRLMLAPRGALCEMAFL
jgi:hypothetical protein